MTNDFFAAPEIDPRLTLAALTTDMAVIKHSVGETNRRLDTLERILSELQTLSRAVFTTQTQTTEHERRLGVLEARAETTDKHIDAIALHERRLETLEADLISNGELRMLQLENTRKWLLGLVGTAATSALGWFLLTYVVPLIRH